ncbi:MAG: TMEM165/GDT1 family protein [Planctomycetes bacterium]|nr:TMEM165/GDT1 family protein [Planctomycetota bacterium]
MDWKLFATTFGAVFLAEFADKTQLATMAFSAESKKPVVVFAAAALALVLVTAIGAAAGALASKWVPAVWVRRVAAVVFIAIGVLLLVSGWRKTP